MQIIVRSAARSVFPVAPVDHASGMRCGAIIRQMGHSARAAAKVALTLICPAAGTNTVAASAIRPAAKVPAAGRKMVRSRDTHGSPSWVSYFLAKLSKQVSHILGRDA